MKDYFEYRMDQARILYLECLLATAEAKIRELEEKLEQYTKTS